MWDLPGPGLEPVSPALAGGFLTTAPPEKPQETYFRKDLKNRLIFINQKKSELWPDLTLLILVIFIMDAY